MMDPQRPPTHVLRASLVARLAVTVTTLVLAAAVWAVQRGEAGGMVVTAVAALAAVTLVADLWMGRIELDADRVRITRLWGRRELSRRDVVAVRKPRTAVAGASIIVPATATSARPHEAYLLPTLCSATRAAALLGVPEFGWGPAADEALRVALHRHRTGGR